MNGLVFITTLLGRCFCQAMIHRHGAKNKFVWKAGKKHYKYIINCLFTKPGHKISTITFTHRKLVDRDTGEKFSADSEKRLINESVSTFEDPDVEWPVE